MHNILNGEVDSGLLMDSFHCASLLFPNTQRKNHLTSHNRYTTPRPTPWPQEKLTLIAYTAQGVAEGLSRNTGPVALEGTQQLGMSWSYPLASPCLAGTPAVSGLT